jgi:5'-methylthioadenosine phosphorylase
MIIQTLNKNTQKAQEAICNLVRSLKAERPCECGNALANALLTDPRVISPETRNKLDLLVGKYLK